jgi:protein-disulfide isomerase
MPRQRIVMFTLVSAILLFAGGGFALEDKCSGLAGEELELANAIKASTYCYDCCDETVSKCLKKKKPCKLAQRLSNEICSRAGKGQSEEKIKSSLERRAKSMMPGAKTYKIDMNGLDTWIGDKDAKVTLTAYMCARCPYCAVITPKLYKAVTKGRLKGKVKIYIRIFPIKSHKYGVEANMAMAAAAKMGKFWPYLLKLYNSFDDFKPEKLVPWAKGLGLKEKEFKALMKDDKIRASVVDSKKEGLKNGVEGTPTFFVNGRKYTADYKIEYFADALEEEYDRKTGSIYLP